MNTFVTAAYVFVTAQFLPILNYHALCYSYTEDDKNDIIHFQQSKWYYITMLTILFQEEKMNKAAFETPNILNKYFYVWALFLPITSILVIPNIQGTFPSTIFAIISFFLVLLVKQRRIQLKGYLWDLVVIFILYTFLSLVSQLINGMVDIPSFDKVILIDPSDTSTDMFRSSFFTQSLYLLAGIITFVYIKRYYNDSWEKPIFIGILLFTIYGIYEFLYFLIFNDYGDFLTNRNFEGHDTINLGNQLMTIGSVVIQRVNGLALEPSMFAFTVLPFWIYSYFTGRKKVSLILFVGLCLSTSTTAILGIFIYLIPYIRKSNKLVLFYIITFLTLFLLIKFDFVYKAFDEIVLQKLQQETASGIERTSFFKNHIDYFLNMNVFSILFGIGFGTVRSTDFFSTILINNGIIGLSIITLLFFYPIIKLKNNTKNLGLKLSLLVIFLTLMISVPEFSFPSIWLFLGIAYNQIFKQKIETY